MSRRPSIIGSLGPARRQRRSEGLHAPAATGCYHGCAMTIPFRPRPLAHRRRQRRRPVVPQHARPRPARRALGLPAASGWPSTTACPASPAPRPRCVIGHVAAGTSTIRVGAGGIMLPNHSPLVIAEQFGTLESLLPGPDRPRPGPRARAPTRLTARALRRNLATDADEFPQDVVELMDYLRPAEPGQQVRAVPGAGLERADLDPRLEPVRRAARGDARPALRVRLAFRAGADDAGDRRSTAPTSSRRSSSRKPYVMLGFNVFAADTDERGAAARHLDAAGVRQPAHAAGRRSCRRPSTAIEARSAPPEQGDARPGAVVLGDRLAGDGRGSG